MDTGTAEEHLRVIRNLMERATVYRAISAPTALVGGIVSILLCVYLWFDAMSLLLVAHGNLRKFVGAWVVVLVLTLVANTLFILRKARREQTPFISRGLRLAALSAAPSVCAAAVVTALLITSAAGDVNPVVIVGFWVLFYGMALLSTSTFAPRSLIILGVLFFASGVVLLSVAIVSGFTAENETAILGMGMTFGLYHLAYAVLTWPRTRASE